MTQTDKNKSGLRVIVHSFFVVPFLIAAFVVLVFFMWKLLTWEPRNAEDYLSDVKTGGATKRWQAAFELSKLLVNKEEIPESDRFVTEMLTTFKYAQYDPDERVKQYLIRAMGQTRNPAFSEVLINSLADANEGIVADVTYALGLIGGKDVEYILIEMAGHSSALVRNRATMGLGNMEGKNVSRILHILLHDSEANVKWSAAIALAKRGDDAGRDILLDLLNRSYLDKFVEVDSYEQSQAILVAINAASILNDPVLNEAIKKLGKDDKNMKIRNAAIKSLNQKI
ncbi:MAG: HEAT repeat domain-containing protein [Candidatus Marinimicrobia bacterium]|nr:HEAT repeat domain-containing protein [Candidatus Neomarinimicrobiota bacterium]MCH8069587.1 HEAT repeat domain-containing protein [Candidatus Neomarinimicrobiota bacterium]